MPRHNPYLLRVLLLFCASLIVSLIAVAAAVSSGEPDRVALLSAESVAPAPVSEAPDAPLPDAEPQAPQAIPVAEVPLIEPLPDITQNQDPRFALGPGDVLQVTVWGYPELSPEQVVILPDGTLSYPLIGTLQAQGLTAQGLGQAISKALEAHMESPQVSVVVTEMRSRSFSVMGAVKTPGVYPLWGGSVSLLEAVARAGGAGPLAVADQVRIFRPDVEPSEPIIVDMTALLKGEVVDPVEIHTGDVVYVPSHDQQKKVCVLGDVGVPGLYPLTDEMTVIDALTAAGWIKPSGVAKSVMLCRRSPEGERQFFRVDAKRAVQKQDWSQHLMLQPGDIVFVPRHFIAKVGDFTGFFTSRVEPSAATYLRVYDATNPANVVIDR
jgi:polysaccharide export outer membrane protein